MNNPSLGSPREAALDGRRGRKPWEAMGLETTSVSMVRTSHCRVPTDGAFGPNSDLPSVVEFVF